MDKEQIQQLILEKIGSVPEGIAKELERGEPTIICTEIAHKLGLDEDAAGEFIDEVYFLMLGLTLKSEFKDALKETFPEDGLAEALFTELSESYLPEIDTDLATMEHQTMALSEEGTDGVQNQSAPDTSLA